MRNRSEPIAEQEKEQRTSELAGVTVGAAFASAAFWILCGITMLAAFSENGLVTNLAAILTEHGLPATSAALVLSVRGGATILGRLGVGFLIDRFSPQRIQTMILALAALGTLVLAYASTPVAASAGAILLGVGLGSEADVLPYLLANYFGRKNFSVLYGLTWTAYAIGGATGPMFLGHLYDRAGAYHSQYVAYLAIVAFSAAAVSLLLRRTRRDQPSDVQPFSIASPISLEE